MLLRQESKKIPSKTCMTAGRITLPEAKYFQMGSIGGMILCISLGVLEIAVGKLEERPIHQIGKNHGVDT